MQGQKLLQQLMNDALIGTTAKTIAILHPKKLAIRELPPGNWAQIYILYQSFCLSQDLDCASRATFYNVTKEWRRALRFRPFSKHSLCTTCDKLKSRMRHAKDFMAHASAADSLLGHLKTTWECRQSYWQAPGRALPNFRWLRQEQAGAPTMGSRSTSKESYLRAIEPDPCRCLRRSCSWARVFHIPE